MADRIGIELPLTDMAVLDYERLMAQGYVDEDISAMYRLKKQR